jgi:hypothetical protein
MQTSTSLPPNLRGQRLAKVYALLLERARARKAKLANLAEPQAVEGQSVVDGGAPPCSSTEIPQTSDQT